MTTLKQVGHTAERAVRRVCEGEQMLGSGSDLAEVLRHLEITESTWHRWRRAYAGMSAADVRRLKELEAENARLKLLAEAELDKAMLKELPSARLHANCPNDVWWPSPQDVEDQFRLCWLVLGRWGWSCCWRSVGVWGCTSR